jgi:hypothetical protein
VPRECGHHRMGQCSLPHSADDAIPPTRRPTYELRSPGFGHITSHVIRKTTATMLDHAGLSARAIADQLGHSNPSLTQDVYLGRQVASAAAAVAFERSELHPPPAAEATGRTERSGCTPCAVAVHSSTQAGR